MATPPSKTFTAFLGERFVASGSPQEIVLKAKALPGVPSDARIIVYDDVTGESVDVSMRGSAEEMAARLLERVGSDISAQEEEPADPDQSPRGRGRPKLGVIAREVTLLPRHWEWLATQPGSASVALRKLVEEARRSHAARDRRRNAQKAAYLFISAMAGNGENFEEATRALFSADGRRFHELMETWPADIRKYAERLAKDAFEDQS